VRIDDADSGPRVSAVSMLASGAVLVGSYRHPVVVGMSFTGAHPLVQVSVLSSSIEYATESFSRESSCYYS
jgi:hypothetical protein